VITVCNLRKTFGDVTAIENISLTAENGRVTGLLGPNGAGKSTTLRVIYGLVKPDSGSAEIDGTDITTSPQAAQQKMGVLPDQLGLYPRLTGREHVQYFGRLHGLSEDALGARTDDLIRMLSMEAIADRRTEGFSHGERMKVCLARALVHDPGNILLDEPTNGLDVMTTRTVRELIGQLRDQGVNVLFSSHLMHEVSRLCDHIVIISGGKVVAEGSTEQISDAAGEDNLEDAFVKLVEGVLN
jgi:sodium transport system ATP-binding protein